MDFKERFKGRTNFVTKSGLIEEAAKVLNSRNHLNSKQTSKNGTQM